MSDSLDIQQNGAVLHIALNRPTVFNSFNREMALALQGQLEAAGNDPAVRCIVLTGNGKAFCAGQDLAEVSDPNGPPLKTILGEHYNPIIRLIRATPKPIIAAVNGVAAGAGANIALACDIVIAAQSASFIQAFSKIGLIPDSGGTYTLPRIVGFQKASALMMLGDKVSAEEAERLGMVYKVVADDAFSEHIAQLAAQVAAMPTRGLALTKEALNESFSNTLEQQLETEERLQIAAGHTHDYNEGVTAFLEKRKAQFVGA
jgi:2-(1,2-epoxy-1,2-dihydrophenyl)acetyl-CoA isomerase